jgi:hypothetical protein
MLIECKRIDRDFNIWDMKGRSLVQFAPALRRDTGSSALGFNVIGAIRIVPSGLTVHCLLRHNDDEQ